MEIKEIKSRLSIATVLQHYNLQTNKHDMLCCPFHEEKEASLKIYPQTNTFNCFGCNANGDTIEFIQLKENCSKHEALKKATELIEPGHKISKTPKATPINKEDRAELLEKLFDYFRSAVYSSHPAKRYAQDERGINVYETEIGYNSAQFHHGKRKDMELINQCVKYGVLTPTNVKTKTGAATGYIVYGKNCLIFPLKNKAGRITGLYGRSIADNTKSKHYYLKDREGLYPHYPKAETTHLILTEAVIDAATLLQLPIITEQYEILSCYGTNGFTAEHTEAVSQLKELEEVIIFFDGDKGGKTAAKKLAKELQQINDTLAIRIVETPEGEDINSIAMGHESEVFIHLIESSNLFLLTESKAEKVTPTEKAKPTTSKLITDNPDQIIYETPELKITIWGGIEKENLNRLKVSMHIKSKGDKYKSFRDDVNLYSHGNTQKLIQNISEALEVSTTAIIKTITELTEELEAYRLEERAATAKALEPKVYAMSEQEKQEALNFLKTKGLGKRTLEIIQQSGLIGEEKNGLLLYFLYTSRLMDEPLHAIIFGKSGSGKTYLQTKISECLPEESVRTITSLTENTLYYSAKDFWKHKVLLIEDLEGVYNAFLPLREFMSKQSISKLTTDKDAKGNNIQKLLTVEGPICVSGATTQGSIYEDNANRSFLLHIDESSNHLNQVMEYQRRVSAGIVNKDNEEKNKQLLKNAQRLLQKVKVVNPYATDLRIPDCIFKKLRTNTHYLKLIEIITFYHQSQRRRVAADNNTFYIETAIEDIELANWLVKETLLQKSDELNNDVRYFFETLKEQLQETGIVTFFAKDIRKSFRMHPMKLSRYLNQLEQRNYIKKISNRQSGFEYEILTFDDYELLKEGINILDKVLENIKAKNNGKKKDLHTSFTSASQIKNNNQTTKN